MARVFEMAIDVMLVVLNIRVDISEIHNEKSLSSPVAGSKKIVSQAGLKTIPRKELELGGRMAFDRLFPKSFRDFLGKVRPPSFAAIEVCLESYLHHRTQCSNHRLLRDRYHRSSERTPSIPDKFATMVGSVNG